MPVIYSRFYLRCIMMPLLRLGEKEMPTFGVSLMSLTAYSNVFAHNFNVNIIYLHMFHRETNTIIIKLVTPSTYLHVWFYFTFQMRSLNVKL